MTTKEIGPRRAQVRAFLRVFQKLQHAVPGLVLLQEGVAGLTGAAHGWRTMLSVAEVATAGAVAISLLMALRKLGADVRARRVPHLHFGVDWADIFLGLMLFTEVASSYPEHHKLWRPATALGLALIFLGIFGGRLAKRRLDRRNAQAAEPTR